MKTQSRTAGQCEFRNSFHLLVESFVLWWVYTSRSESFECWLVFAWMTSRVKQTWVTCRWAWGISNLCFGMSSHLMSFMFWGFQLDSGQEPAPGPAVPVGGASGYAPPLLSDSLAWPTRAAAIHFRTEPQTNNVKHHTCKYTQA